MQYLFEAWCRDPRPLVFGEFLDELYTSWENWLPASAIGQELAALYRECHRRIRADERFALCHTSINDPHQQNERDAAQMPKPVVSMLSQIIRNVLKERCPNDGFVAYLGGSQFIFLFSVSQVPGACSEILDRFDLEVAQEHGTRPRTLKIGVVTNEQRHFLHFAQIMELVVEMSRYGERTAGSVFIVDRRTEPEIG